MRQCTVKRVFVHCVCTVKRVADMVHSVYGQALPIIIVGVHPKKLWIVYCKNEWYIPKLWVGREYFIVVPDLINYPEYRTALVFKTQTTFALNALLRTEIYFAKLIWFVHWNCLSPNNNKVCKKEKQDWVQFCWFSFSTLKMFSVQTSFLFWLSLLGHFYIWNRK